MVGNIDNNWAAIQQKINSNTNFDFFDDLIKLSEEIKSYDKGYSMKTILCVSQTVFFKNNMSVPN